MPILKNTTDQPITSATNHTVPPHGTLAVSDRTLETIGKEPYIARRLREGALTIAADPAPEPEAEPLTRATIARARKDELVEILEAHSVTGEQIDGKTADELREMAARVVFVDL